ncbi:MAG: DUF222 domain-containing protein [Acidimicrobiia bacterium]
MTCEAMDGVRAAIDQLVDTDPAVLADSDTVVALHRQLARLEAAVTRATGTWDARQDWALDGGRSGASWLTARCQLPKPSAHRRVRLARALRDLPVAEQAWLAGDLDSSHVALLAANRTVDTGDAMTRDEPMLVEDARQLPHRHFARVVAYWRQVNDPDGAEHDAERLHQQRHLTLAQTWKGGWHADLFLDPIGGTILTDALRAIEQELFDTDWAHARAARGDLACRTDLARTGPQRRADALVELARRALATPPGARPPAPLFTVLVGYETFHGRICELAGGTAVTPGSLLPWLEPAVVERVVFDTPSRVIDIGTHRRLFTGATRRAIQVRDRECYHPLCDQPADRCDIDHIHPHALGGPTTQANGRPACPQHNRLRNQPGPAP